MKVGRFEERKVSNTVIEFRSYRAHREVFDSKQWAVVLVIILLVLMVFTLVSHD